MIDHPEFFRTQREARIQHAPWAEQRHLDRAAGFIAGLFIVMSGTLVAFALCVRIVRALGGAS